MLQVPSVKKRKKKKNGVWTENPLLILLDYLHCYSSGISRAYFLSQLDLSVVIVITAGMKLKLVSTKNNNNNNMILDGIKQFGKNIITYTSESNKCVMRN